MPSRIDIEDYLSICYNRSKYGLSCCSCVYCTNCKSFKDSYLNLRPAVKNSIDNSIGFDINRCKFNKYNVGGNV